MSMTPEDFLNQAGGGGKGFAFKDPSDMNVWKGGTVQFFQVRQATKFGTRTPDFDDAGNPVMEMVVACLCDDGERRAFYAKAQMAQALREAMVAAYDKVQAPEIGGTLMCRWIGTKPSNNPAFEPQKLYEFTFTPPAPAAAAVVDAMKLA